MKRLPASLAIGLFVFTQTTTAVAQIYPIPGNESPRVQSVQWLAGEPVLLTALPETTLTVMLEPGETIQRAILAGDNSWNVVISSESDSFQVTPQANAASAVLLLESDRRTYEFTLESETGLFAAYLVRLEYARGNDESAGVATDQLSKPVRHSYWSYRFGGDRSVRPISVRDDGKKTVIEYSDDQPIPAVFALGTSGHEEVVDGYMRDGKFVIDRVHDRLIFRIDNEKATARRNKQRDDE